MSVIFTVYVFDYIIIIQLSNNLYNIIYNYNAETGLYEFKYININTIIKMGMSLFNQTIELKESIYKIYNHHVIKCVQYYL